MLLTSSQHFTTTMVIRAVWILLAIFYYYMFHQVEGLETYVVGDEQGWNLYTDYSEWVRGKQFHVGDILVFKYEKGEHNVVQVTSSGYEECVTDSNLKMYASGNDSIRLNNAGRFWYICGIDDHCDFGQKLNINVVRL